MVKFKKCFNFDETLHTMQLSHAECDTIYFPYDNCPVPNLVKNKKML